MYRIEKAECVKGDLPKGAIILDVRTGIEHAETSLGRHHVHIPLDELNATQLERACGANKNTPVYILCKAGVRARKAAEKLATEGFSDLHVVEGGLDACIGAGVTCGSNHSIISLERQVRITAGSLVLAGFLLGVFVSPAWHALSGFVGAGLIFAGVTNKCGMALLIARAPWNKKS